MVNDATFGQGRRQRADGERNRQRLLIAAKRAFTANGASTSLEQIAREAGVGIGTLYRHFATRDALVEAVYREEIDALARAADHFAATEEPVAALWSWLHLFIDFLETKRDMGEVLGTLIGGAEPLYSGTPAHLAEPMHKLLSAANAGGGVKLDMPPLDLLRAIAGVATIRPSPGWKAGASALIGSLLDT